MDKNEARKSICLIANNLKLLKMKKIIITASGLLFAASLYVGINAYTNSNPVNDLLLANIEALARNEGNWEMQCTWGTRDDGGSYILFCETCSYVRIRMNGNHNTCPL